MTDGDRRDDPGQSRRQVLQVLAQHRTQLPTPLYLYSERELDDAADALLTLFPSGTRLFYSLKANPQPAIVAHFAARGIAPEIASGGERVMCERAGVDPGSILVGGVAKTRSALEQAAKHGCRALVIDSVAEWQRLKDMQLPLNALPLLFRVAPGVALGGLDMAGNSQFGSESAQVLTMARECIQLGLDFRGLHFYFGSQRLKPEPVVDTLAIATRVLGEFRDAGVSVPVVDVGLGCGVNYLERDRPLEFDTLRERLDALWADPAWEGVEVWSEAGRALAAPGGYFISRVVEVKQLHGKRFVLLDGGLNCHNPGVGVGRFLRSNPVVEFVSEGEGSQPVNLAGNLCTSADLLAQDVPAPELSEGDLVVIPNSGAYTQTTGLWGFNSRRPFSEMWLDKHAELTVLQSQHRLWQQAHE